MSNVLKTISLDGFSKNVLQYEAGENINITTDETDANKRIISAVATDLSDYYTKSEVDDLIDAIDQFKVEVVNELPVTGEEKTIYLAPKSPTQTNNARDEYLWINNAWEKIGDTEIDLSDYYTKSETDGLLDDKQGTLAAGANIQIAQDGTISATDTTYEVATQSADGLMSSTDKAKLDGIEAGAEENVQSDWNQADATADDFIKNKPGNATQSTAGLMSDTDKTKLDGITWDKAGILAAMGYEEVTLSMTDTDGNTITKTILAEIEQ